MFEHREGHPAHHPVLGQPLVCRMAAVVSLYRSSQTASVFDGGYIKTPKCDCARSTAAGPPTFEHREGHPAPPGADGCEHPADPPEVCDADH